MFQAICTTINPSASATERWDKLRSMAEAFVGTVAPPSPGRALVILSPGGRDAEGEVGGQAHPTPSNL